MKTLAYLVAIAVLAQDKPAEPQKPDAPKPDEAKPAAQAAAPDANASPERWLTGSFEIGHRWRTGPAGSSDAYRSVVDLGEGVRLLNLDFTIADPKRRLFDTIDIGAANWGDDPYSTARLRARKARQYDLRSDYRNFAYFNSLPSFANPFLDRGIFVSQRALDTRRRLASTTLDLFPGRMITPYVTWERQSGYGRGVTGMALDFNEYAVPTLVRDAMDHYRAGARFEALGWHATVEQGGTAFKDDQQVFEPFRNEGNRASTFLGQRLFLNRAQQAYAVRGDSVYTRASVTASPLSWLDINANLLSSRPQTNTTFNEFATGNIFAASQALFVTSQQLFVVSQARLPHTSGQAGIEIRPFRRVRAIANYLTDRLNQQGSAAGNIFAGLRNNYSQTDADLLVDVTSWLTLRAGYRETWGDALISLVPAAGLPGQPSSQLKRKVGKGGMQLRITDRIRINGDVEGATANAVPFRTSLADYVRSRVRASYQVMTNLRLSADVAVLFNENPSPAAQAQFEARQTSLALHWAPRGGKRLVFHGSYTRSSVRSDIQYIAPQFFERERSLYRDNAHTADALFDWTPGGWLGQNMRLSAGGVVFLSSGSRPTRHYQPLIRTSVPIARGVAWFGEWRYHGFGEALYLYEGFRSHLVTTGLRFER